MAKEATAEVWAEAGEDKGQCAEEWVISQKIVSAHNVAPLFPTKWESRAFKLPALTVVQP